MFWVKHASIAVVQPKQTALNGANHLPRQFGYTLWPPVEVTICSNFDWIFYPCCWPQSSYPIYSDQLSLIPTAKATDKKFPLPNHLDFSWKEFWNVSLFFFFLENIWTNLDIWSLGDHLQSKNLSRILSWPHFPHLGWPCFIKTQKETEGDI